MTSMPLLLDENEPVGLVVAMGRGATRPARIWAYLWSADTDDHQEPPHRRVPVFPAE